MTTFLERLRSSQPAEGHFAVVPNGYSRREVDAFLAQIENGVQPEDSDLMNRMFTVARKGYDRPAVHRHLANLVSNRALLDFTRIERLAA